jgi:hypothetical protein
MIGACHLLRFRKSNVARPTNGRPANRTSRPWITRRYLPESQETSYCSNCGARSIIRIVVLNVFGGRRSVTVPGNHDDLKRLIEFSIEDGMDAAIPLFPMFSAEQVRGLYDISILQRLRLLQTWGTDDSATAHFLRHFRDPHDPAQAEKIREQSRDPSNK